MTRCTQHDLHCEGSCQWCGKEICKQCIGKKLGTKLFCKDCSEDVGGIVEKRQRQIIAEQEDRAQYEKNINRIIQR